jgi:hypothetical protein
MRSLLAFLTSLITGTVILPKPEDNRDTAMESPMDREARHFSEWLIIGCGSVVGGLVIYYCFLR